MRIILSDLKLNPDSFKGKNIKALPNNPSQMGITAAELKAAFDHVGEQILAVALNAVIDVLSGGEGASNIGSVGGITVQDHINIRVNPHLVTKAQVGLSEVQNFSPADMPMSFLAQLAIDTLTANVLTKDNTTPYEPTDYYHPVTLKKLQDAQFQSGSVSSVFGQAGDVHTLDCGDWDMSEIEAHNRNSRAHQYMAVDGLQAEPTIDSDNLEQHKINEDVHGNVILDGGKF